MHNTRYQFRLPRQMLNSWRALVPDRVGSKVMRMFMHKAMETVRRNGNHLPRLLLGEYDIVPHAPRQPRSRRGGLGQSIEPLEFK